MTIALPAQTTRARAAVIAAFFVAGFNVANFVSRIPDIKASLGLDEGGFGLTLVGMSVGTVAAIFTASPLVARYGSRRMSIIGALLLSLILPTLALMPTSIGLWLALFAFGGALAITDVAMNAQAVQVERDYARSIMSSFHATYSVGGLAGALIGAQFVRMGVTPLAHFVIMAGVALLFTVWFAPRLLDLQPTGKTKRGSAFSFPHPALWGLGAITFCAFLAEGSVGDWSGIYMRDVLKTDASTATLGYAGFSLTMTVCRILGDRLTNMLPGVVIVRGGGALAALGLILAIAAQALGSPFAAIIGFSIVGIGLAVVVPLAFSAAGNKPGFDPEVGLAGTATLGYLGLLAGPPVIGLIARVSSLTFSFALVTLLCASLIFSARALSVKKV